jgi:hypothetical protein
MGLSYEFKNIFIEDSIFLKTLYIAITSLAQSCLGEELTRDMGSQLPWNTMLITFIHPLPSKN